MSWRVFLADDHPILRAGVAALLQTELGCTIVGEAGTADETVKQCLELRPDVAIVDLAMPGEGVEAIRRLHDACPEVRCIALTMHNDPAYMFAVLEAGGVGYVVKEGAADELSSCVRTVASGRTQLTINSTRGAVSAEPLSPREREVLTWLARGYSNSQIGIRLGVKTKTIDSYRDRLRHKLGLAGRPEIVEYALRAGLLVPHNM